MTGSPYSMTAETKRILDLITSLVPLPLSQTHIRNNVSFTSYSDFPYFPIPFKETEVAAALKAIEGNLASALVALDNDKDESSAPVTVNLEKTTAFLFQAYLATVGGLGKLDKEVKRYLKGTMIIRTPLANLVMGTKKKKKKMAGRLMVFASGRHGLVAGPI